MPSTLVAQIAAAGKPILILTGGEPLLRPTSSTIAEAARERRTAGGDGAQRHPGHAAAAARMKAAGIARISVSIDFPDAADHDRFRGWPGAFDSALQGIAGLGRRHRDPGESTITGLNVRQLPRLLARPRSLGAVSFHPFMLVPTGRGRDLADQELGSRGIRAALKWMYDAQQRLGLFFKPTDVPHYWRVMRQRAKADDGKIEMHPYL